MVPFFFYQITIKAHDGNNYKFICNCTIMKIKQLFPEGKKPPVVPGEIPWFLILKGIDFLNEVSCIVELFMDFCELMAVA